MFKDRLKDLRKHRGYSQSRLAEEIGVVKSTISMYESGTREPNFETLEAIADVLNVRISSLLDGTPTDLPYNLIPLSALKTKKIPLLGTIACGEPILAEENIEKYLNRYRYVI